MNVSNNNLGIHTRLQKPMKVCDENKRKKEKYDPRIKDF